MNNIIVLVDSKVEHKLSTDQMHRIPCSGEIIICDKEQFMVFGVTHDIDNGDVIIDTDKM